MIKVSLWPASIAGPTKTNMQGKGRGDLQDPGGQAKARVQDPWHQINYPKYSKTIKERLPIYAEVFKVFQKFMWGAFELPSGMKNVSRQQKGAKPSKAESLTYK